MQDEGENVEKLPSDRFGSRFLLLGYEPDGETARERKREREYCRRNVSAQESYRNCIVIAGYKAQVVL